MRWKVKFLSPLGSATFSSETIASGICLSQFMEGPQLKSLDTHSKRSPLQQSITIQSEGSFIRIGFPSILETISSEDKILWKSSQTDLSLNHEIIVAASTSFTVRFKNGEIALVDLSPSTWMERLASDRRAKMTVGIVAAHLVIFALLSLQISRSQQIDEPILDISKVEVLLTSPATGSSYSPAPTTPQKSHWNQLLKGMNLKSPRISLSSSNKTAPAFPRVTESATKDFFGYETSAPRLESSAGVNINTQQIADSLRPYQARLKDCYSEALFLDGGLRGKAELRLNVTSVGRIESLELSGLEGSNHSQQSLRNCFQQVLNSARLPATSQDFAVSQSLVLYQ